MKTRYSLLLLSLFASFFIFPGCVKDKIKDLNVTYQGTLAFPVAQVGFTLGEVLEEDTLLTIDDDNAIRLVYRNDNLFSLNAADYLDEITDDLLAEQSENFQIGAVAIADDGVQSNIIFNSIVDDFDNNTLKQFFLDNDGNSLPVPAFQEDLNEVFEVPAFADYNYIEVESGKLKLSLVNNLFFDVQNMTATVFDNTNGAVVGVLSYDFIPIGGAKSAEIDLAGKTMGNAFRMEIETMGSPGSAGAPVTFDLQSSLQASLEIVGVTIRGGQASLPAGTYLEDEFLFDFGLGADQQIYRLELESGNVGYTINAGIGSDFLLRVAFPDVLQNGSVLTKEIQLSGSGPTTGDIDFGNTDWRLDQDTEQAFNRLRVEYELLLPTGTGMMVEFSAEEEVGFQLVVNDLQPNYVEGHLGRQAVEIEPGVIELGVDFSLFDEASSPILFTDPSIRIQVENSFGLPLGFEFQATSIGAFGGQANLDPPSPLLINYPDMSMTGETAETNFLLNKNNSGIVDMLANFPTSITYEGTAIANPTDVPGSVNFVTAESSLTASAEIELPFKFRTENLVYSETGAAVNLDLEDGLTVEDIDSAVLKILYRSDLPLRAEFLVNTIADNGSETNVIDGIILEAATANSEGRVEADGAATGEIYIRLSQAQIMQLDNAVENIYLMKFQTPQNGQLPSAMYTDYDVELNMGMTITFDK